MNKCKLDDDALESAVGGMGMETLSMCTRVFHTTLGFIGELRGNTLDGKSQVYVTDVSNMTAPVEGVECGKLCAFPRSEFQILPEGMAE